MGKGNKAYRRSKVRRAPHNAYTSTVATAADGAQARCPDGAGRGRSTAARSSIRRPSRRGHAADDPGARTSTNVITYAYDRDRNSYRRSVDGEPHVDAADDKRVTTTNVVVLYQKFRIDTKIEPGHSRPDIKTIGSGKALVFREGKVVTATWKKEGDADPTLLLDKSGNEIPLVRGRTFIQVVPPTAKVTHRD